METSPVRKARGNPLVEQAITGEARQESLAGEVVWNVGVRLLGFAASKCMLLVMTAVVARYLGTENFGKYSFVLTYLVFFQILTDPGVSALLLQKLCDTAKLERARLLGSTLLLRFALSCLAVGASVGLLLILGYPADIQKAALIGSLGFLVGRSDVYTVVFQAHLKQQYIAYTELLEQLVATGLIVLVVIFDLGFLAVFVATAAGSGARFFVSWLLSGKFTKTEFRVDLTGWRDLLRSGLPIAVGAVFGTVVANLDLLTVQKMMGNDAAGYYGAAKRLISPWGLIPGTYVSVVYPILYKLFVSGDRDRFALAYEKSFRYMLMVIVPVATGVSLTAKSIMRIIYGEQFLESSMILAIIVWSQVFLFVKLVNDYLLITIGKQRASARVAGMSALTNILLNIVLCHKYGAEGAAISCVTSYSLFLPLQCTFSEGREYSLAILRQAVKPAVAASAMALFVAFVLRFQLLASLVAGPLIYAGVLVAVGGVGTSDLLALSKVILGRSGSEIRG